MSNNQKCLRVTLIRSTNKKLAKHRACVKGLGLHRIGETVEVVATPETLGMVNKISYLLKVEEV